MPLPSGNLEFIKEKLDAAEERIKSMEEVIADLRASGIDALKQEERLDELKGELRKWSTFYERQRRRPTE